MKHFRYLVLAASLVAASTANAVPLLQLYVEGATYNTDHESWVFENPTADPIRLWVIGNTQGPGSKGTIYDVKLAVTYQDLNPGAMDASVELSAGTTGGYGEFVDPSTPQDAVFSQYNDQGDIPLMGDGTPIATHGVYGDGWEWQEFLLGDFDQADSPIGDFIDAVPQPLGDKLGQINVYEINISGDISDVHFDAYDHVQSKNRAKYVFAPYSHDAGTGINHPVAVPAPLVLIGLGLIGLVTAGRLRAS